MFPGCLWNVEIIGSKLGNKSAEVKISKVILEKKKKKDTHGHITHCMKEEALGGEPGKKPGEMFTPLLRVYPKFHNGQRKASTVTS